MQTNADRTVHQGVEAGLGVAFAKSVFTQEDRFWLNVVYNYNDFHFDRDALWGNNRLPGAPPYSIRTEILYKNPNGFYAGPNVEWMPQSFYADNANTLTVDPYALLNFKIGYDKGAGWSGYVEGRKCSILAIFRQRSPPEGQIPPWRCCNPGTVRIRCR